MSAATKIREFFTPNITQEPDIGSLNNAYSENDTDQVRLIVEEVFSNFQSSNTQYENIINKFGFDRLEEILEGRDNAFFTSMITNPKVSVSLIEKLGDFLVQRIISGTTPDYYVTLLSDASVVIQTREQLRNWKPDNGKDFYTESGLNRNSLTPLQRNRIQTEMKYYQGKDADGFKLNYPAEQKAIDTKDFAELKNYRRLQFCLNNVEIRQQYLEDTTKMLANSFGLDTKEALKIAELRINAVENGKNMSEIRRAVQRVQIENGIDIGSVKDTLEERSDIIFNQNIPFLIGAKRVGDIGCGNGVISKKMLESEKLPIITQVIGTDPVKYLAEGIENLPGFKFEKTSLLELPHEIGDASLDALIITNVAHHHKNPCEKKALLEAWIRKLKPNGRLLFTETTSRKNDIAIFRQMVSNVWLNDIDYNHYISEPIPKEGDKNTGGNIPVPGGFDIMSNWVKILKSLGMDVTNMSELGFDIPAIQDFHIQMITVKKPTSKAIIASNISSFNEAKEKRNQRLALENKKSDRSNIIFMSGTVGLLIVASNFGLLNPAKVDMWFGASNNQNTPITRNIG
jgi:SAM-dependent methyltransferase